MISAELRRRCEARFADGGIEPNARRVALSVDMRYARIMSFLCRCLAVR